MNRYCMYLRKSRADYEAEAHGEGETLARHRAALLALAKRQNLPISQIYEEIVSGDTIAARPVMQQLLDEVSKGQWDGVLVMEIERLARGDTIDQGLVVQSFKYSDTKIITPMKTYNPNDEFDEEYFEFGLFMSRREYKTINRRLQRGREASAREGKFVGSKAPYGYKRKKLENEKGATLEIIPEQAEIVRLIFDLYVNGIEENGSRKKLGLQSVARKLNEMGIPSYRHDYWQKESIRTIIENPTYAGLIRWGWRKQQKLMENGKTIITRPITNDNCIIAEGMHEAIISRETYDKAQEILKEAPPMPVGYKKEIQSPLSGLVVCAVCGRKMVIRKAVNENKSSYLVCHARSCPNVSAPLHLVEKRMLSILQSWVGEYKVQATPQETEAAASHEKSLQSLDKELQTLDKQLQNTFDLVERGIYTDDVFVKRSTELTERINAAQEARRKLVAEMSSADERSKARRLFVPKIEALLDTYDTLDSPAEKNIMLKEVVSRAVYRKEISGMYKGHCADDFELIAYPAVPKEDDEQA